MNGSRSYSPQEIADFLRDRIRTGDLKAGDRLPTQADLAEEFGVERGAVRQALRLLQEAGLLTVSKGSPPRIAEQSPVPGEPQPTMVALAPRLSEAFAESQVRLDAACLTAESLMLAVGESVRLIHEGRARPKSIDVRVLLPSREITLAFPAPVDGRGEDDPVHQRWLTMRNAQAQVLQHNLLALRATHGIDVHVTFRALVFTPPIKLYLLNGEEALLGYYVLDEREEEYNSQTLEMYDILGSQSVLFSFLRSAGERDAAFVEQSQRWFDALWKTITTDLTLS
ncbi:winged helix-turn-helix domain-containing protein [Streptomyces sp. R08]|uniref:Winged helix-turn-helix domain-containing protein n=1 Tax=Streptomyces sp. R08 TaxID=3238624 RepID=A0AB39MF56_9ACTN